MRALSNVVIDTALALSTLAGRAWLQIPMSNGTKVARNVPYGPHARHHLDCYAPAEPRGLRVLYLHGGSFRACSKESHTYVGRVLAAAGLHVYIIDYGLAPRFAYPTAHDDALKAYRWLCSGPGRSDKVATAGDSAGANLALSIAIEACGGFESDRGRPRRPDAVVSLSGLLRVRGGSQAYAHHRVVRARLGQIEADFLAGQSHTPRAEPLAALESDAAWVAAMPPAFIGTGTLDPLADESRLLASRLPESTLRTYPRQGHAFMVSPLRRAARRCWADVATFLHGVTR